MQDSLLYLDGIGINWGKSSVWRGQGFFMLCGVTSEAEVQSPDHALVVVHGCEVWGPHVSRGLGIGNT